MAPEREVHLHLYLAERSGTLSGRVRPDGGPEQTFTGWIGLNAAIDELIRTDPTAAAPGAAAVPEDDGRDPPLSRS